jgi:xylan 1,4-beta-xylosidase
MKYQNPIIGGFHPDPSVCRVGQDYYLVTSSFEFFPGVPVYHSRDLVNWKQIGHCLTRKSQLPLDKAHSSGGIYAPTIRHHNGRFYMVTTNVSHGGNFYVHTDNPAGEWSEPIWVDQPGIDPSLLFDEDQKAYFVSNGSKTTHGKQGAFQSQIDIATGKLIGECQYLWGGTGGAYPEGPHVFRKDGWYYLLMAEGGTEFGHMVTISRSRNVFGPFEPCPHNPILTHRSIDTALQSTGHSDLFADDQGRWWIVFLACRHVGYPKMHHIGRETSLAPVEWDKDGWPVVNGGKVVGLEVSTDRLNATQVPSKGQKDEFDSPQLGLEWNFRRNPDDSAWSLSQRKGALALRCIAATLNDQVSPAFVGRRQEHLACTASTVLDFAPKSPADEAGLTILMNDSYHCELAVMQRDGRRVVVARRCMGSLVAETAVCPIGEGPVVLQVRAEPEWYHLSAQVKGGEAVSLGKVETRHLATELAGGFTGVYFGMYATGNGTDSQGMGYFDWFDYVVG